MENQKNRPDVKFSMKPGFSLVEVIIAVTLLALLAVPILAYFTNAAVSSSRGKNTQKANMAAQTVLEDLNSCDTFEQIEEKITEPDASGVPSPWKQKQAYDSTSRTMELERNITVDGYTYQAVVRLDYKGDSDTYTSLTDRFNNYDEPLLQEVYSKNNVVFAEKDQEEEALSEFLYANPTKKKTDIQASMNRSICLTMQKEMQNGVELYQVAGYYHYTYNGASYDAYLDDTKIQASQLNNMYFFYKAMAGHGDQPEQIQINYDPSVDLAAAQKFKVYFVCQKPKPTGLNYKLEFSGSGNYTQSTYYTNEIPATLSSYKDNLIDSKFGSDPIKRIAKITVDVYDQSASTDSVVHLETSKGE